MYVDGPKERKRERKALFSESREKQISAVIVANSQPKRVIISKKTTKKRQIFSKNKRKMQEGEIEPQRQLVNHLYSSAYLHCSHSLALTRPDKQLVTRDGVIIVPKGVELGKGKRKRIILLYLVLILEL